MNKLLLCALIPGITFANGLGIKVVPAPLKLDATYTQHDMNYPKVLMNTKNDSKREMMNASFQSDPLDTHLKNTLAQVQVDHRIPAIRDKEIIGYTASGGYSKDGWSGAKTFFADKDLGTCEYENVRIYGLTIDNNAFNHDVNGKITTYNTYGDDKSGYLYTIDWFEENKDKTVLSNTLTCAKLGNDLMMKEKLTSLANKIDIS